MAWHPCEFPCFHHAVGVSVSVRPLRLRECSPSCEPMMCVQSVLVGCAAVHHKHAGRTFCVLMEVVRLRSQTYQSPGRGS